MRKTIQLLSLAGALMFTTFGIAQNEVPKIEKSVVETLNTTPNLGFGVSQERPLRSAFMMYEQMKANGVKFDNYEIVIWGKIVKEIAENKELSSFLSKYMDEDLSVTVCSVAMDKLGVKASDLPKDFKVVDDAYVRIFELQALGYNFLIP